ncbi:MAG TPA: hypothetical protein VG098_00335 [Nitrososphaera sp.]|nr:hypothetical protein [Nitrososphaera sp.]
MSYMRMNSITKEVLLYIFHNVVIMPFQNYMVSRDIGIRMIGGPVGPWSDIASKSGFLVSVFECKGGAKKVSARWHLWK